MPQRKLHRAWGHKWQRRKGVCPLLSHGYEVVRIGVPRVSYVSSSWIVDYAFTPAGRYRVGGDDGRSWQREARLARLYPPGVSFVYETASVRHPIQTAFIGFHRGREAGLKALIDRDAEHARLRDPLGILGRELKRIAEVGVARGDAGFWEAQAHLCRIVDLLTHSERLDNAE